MSASALWEAASLRRREALISVGMNSGECEIVDVSKNASQRLSQNLHTHAKRTIHTSLDLAIGSKIRHKCRQDLVAIILHDILELRKRRIGNILFGSKGFIELHFGHGGTHHIKNVGLNLTTRIREAIIGIIGTLQQDTILNGNADLDKD